MLHFLDFKTERTQNKAILQNTVYSHKQKILVQTHTSINADDKDFVQIEATLNAVIYEYKQYLNSYKKEDDCSFDMYASVGIFNKEILMRFSYYTAYTTTTQYQKLPAQIQNERKNVTPISAQDLMILLKHNISQMLDYSESYAKE